MNVAVRLWTAERVEERLTDALRIVVRNAGSIGPRAYANSMPESDPPTFSELIWYGDKRWEEEAKARIADILRKVERFVSPGETRAAEEALAWPNRFLADPRLRDGVWTVLLGRALGANVDKILARRRAAADAMIDRYKAEAGPDIVRIYEDDARDIASKWVERANIAMALPLTEGEQDKLRQAKLHRLRLAAGPKKARKIKLGDIQLSADEIADALKRRNDRIKIGIAVQFRREARRTGCVERIVQTNITRQDVMLGKHFNPRHLYSAFHKGVAAIAAALSGGVSDV